MIIVGITGTLGAGKGTVVDHLKNKYDFKHYSARDFLTAEVIKRDLPVNRDSMVEVGNDLRAQNHPGYIVEQLYKLAFADGHNAVIESVRTPGEIDVLENLPNFYLVAVDADPKIRYDRIVLRNSSTDNVSFDHFKADEEREMTSVDPNKQNLAACIKRAKYLFLNNGSFEDLFFQVDEMVNQINHV